VTRTVSKARSRRATRRSTPKVKTTSITFSAWNPFQDLPKRKDGSEEGINISQIQEFIRCPYRWHLRNRRMIARRTIAPPMDLGSAVHAGLAGAIRVYGEHDSPTTISDAVDIKMERGIVAGIRAFKKKWIEEHGEPSLEIEQELTQLQITAFDITKNLLRDLELTRYKILTLGDRLLVEQRLVIPFADTGLLFYGTPDVVWEDRSKGGNWPCDFKIREKMQPVEHEEVDVQLPGYQYLLQQIGIPTVGAMKIQGRAALPREPEMTQKGGMSRQRIMTTWDVYKAALLRHKLKPDDYLEMQQKLDCEFFRADLLYRNQFVIGSFWNDIILPLGMQLIRSEEFIRHMHFINCGGCWAREFCIGELRGEDTGFLLETQFVDLASPTPRIPLRPEDIVITMDDAS
jgi:CRISPR/Cas system-associated exonuclease Cas4 (RecB family)